MNRRNTKKKKKLSLCDCDGKGAHKEKNGLSFRDGKGEHEEKIRLIFVILYYILSYISNSSRIGCFGMRHWNTVH